MKRFSIIMPVRNGGHHVKECIQSILSQTLNDYNVIVFDSQSTDGTPEWIESLKNENIIIYRSKESLTIEQNWSRIKDVQKNEFMTLIGHDDLLDSDYLETMDNLIKKHPSASLYQTHFNYIDAAGVFLRECQPMAEVQKAHEFLECQINMTLDSTGTGYMMRSKDYDEIGGISALYPKLIFADYELWMKLILKSYKATSAKKCFSYRLHNSASKLTNGEDYQQAFIRYMSFLKGLTEKNESIAIVVQKDVKKMLLYFCESLSHRLLKTPRSQRKTSVSAFIKSCQELANSIIPNQPFLPLVKPGILAAKLLDNRIGLFIFSVYKRLGKK